MSDGKHPVKASDRNTARREEPLPTPAPFPIVGIGASAGGLEAISKLLGNLRADSGMAFLIVQHLGPDHASMLTEILSRETVIPIAEAKDGEAVECNHIYVIPPNTSMMITQGRLVLRPRNEVKGVPMPVDDLFHSLAEDQGVNAIGVSLSGSGTDGALGIQAIKAEGGITFAQDRASAKFSGMPQAAVELQCVDFILSPQEIAQKLGDIAHHFSPATIAFDSKNAAGVEKDMQRVFRLMNSACNIDFTHYKSGTVKRRLTRRLALNNLQALPDYIALLEDDHDEVQALCQDFLIGVTSFFRDPNTFKGFTDFAFPRLLKERSPKVPLRIWVPGCASGEEVYSIAICLLEYLDNHDSTAKVQIFGTDVSETALDKAREGYYVENIARYVSADRLQRFFVKTNGHYQISKSIRELCIFARHNVTCDPPFSRLDLISCKNLLIYLDPVLQQQVVPLFHYALGSGGMLMLGPSESVGGFSELFDLTGNKEFKVYTKKDLPERVQREYLGVYFSQSPPRQKITNRTPSTEAAMMDKRKWKANRITLARYVPAGVLCDEHLNILEFRGDTSPYLIQPSGAPSTDLRKLARPGLLVEISGAIQQVRRDAAAVRREGVRLETPMGTRNVNLEVIPIPSDAMDSWFLIFFEESSGPALPTAKAGGAGFWVELVNRLHHSGFGGNSTKSGKDTEIAQLKRELEATQDHAKIMMEEHELAKEELQVSQQKMLSSNEEFQSSNEELETAKEELQSANQELITTNEELRYRNHDLNALNNKLRQTLDYAEAIIKTVRQPLLVLDGDLHIQRANPAFYATFKTTVETTENSLLYELGNRQWDIPELRKFLENILSEKGTVLTDYEITHMFPDIGKKTMLLNGTHLAWDEHALILLAIDDISDYKQAVDTLKDNDRYKDEFLAMLAHELRNPLAPIQSALEILKRGDAGEEAEKAARMIMERQLHNEVRLVDDLLDVSRITSGSIGLRQEVVDLVQVVKQAVATVSHHFEARNHAFTLSMPENNVVVRGDTLRLEQIVGNLLTNAAKYTRPGGHIFLTLEQQEMQAVLTVADNGIGIAPELLPCIFDLFTQAELSLDRTQGGLGIGLTLVRRLVELQGGTVEARSEGLKKGSQFIVRLPVLVGVDVPPVAPARPMPKSAPASSRRILIVDDSADAVAASALLLKLLGHDIQTSIDGPTAIETARTFKPDVILLDIGLPGMDGYEVARHLRKMPETRKTCLIALSGYGQAEDFRRSTEAGFDHHLVKPATIESLQALI